MADNNDLVENEEIERAVDDMEVQPDNDVRTLEEEANAPPEADEETKEEGAVGEIEIQPEDDVRTLEEEVDPPPEADQQSKDDPVVSQTDDAEASQLSTEDIEDYLDSTGDLVIAEKPEETGPSEETRSTVTSSEDTGVVTTSDNLADKNGPMSMKTRPENAEVDKTAEEMGGAGVTNRMDAERFREAPQDREFDIPAYKVPQPDDFEINPSPSFKPKPKAKVTRKGNYIPITDTLREMWKVPFEDGWGREIVFRSTQIDGKRVGDVYYFSPEGKKFRSTKEIEKYLIENHNPMSVDCFTFRKEPVFKEPFEIIRNAKGNAGLMRKSMGSPAMDSPERLDQVDHPGSGKKKKAKQTNSPGLKVKFTKAGGSFAAYAPKNKGLKSPTMVKSETLVKSPEIKTMKFAMKKPVRSGNVAKKHTGKRKPMAVLLNGSGKKPKISSENGQRLCDLTCGQAAPSLHCEVCMCLFHPNCVGFTPRPGSKFVCRSCNEGEQSKGASEQAVVPDQPSVQPRLLATHLANASIGTVVRLATPVASLVPPVAGTTSVIRTPTGIRHQLINATPLQSPIVTSRQPIRLNIPTSSVNPDQISGQLITLPPHVTNKLNLTKPLNLKLNGQTYNIPPKCFIATNEGVKVLLPPGSLPDNIAKGGPGSPLAMSASSNTNLQQLSMRPMVESDGGAANGTSATGVVDLTEDLTGHSASTAVVSSSQGKTTPKRKTKLHVPKSVCHFGKLHAGFDCMIHIFQYLGTTDLLRVQMVCRTWCSVASETCLWKTLRLRNVRVTDWEKAASYMARQRTQALDLRLMAHPNNDANRTWHQLHSVLGQLKCVRQVEFSQCPSSILHALTEKLSNLQRCIAEFIVEQVQDSRENNAKLDLGKFSNLTQLECLKLRGVQGLVLPAFSFSGGLQELASLVKLKTLALTTLRDLPANEFQFLGSLTNLESLEVGDTMSWSEETFEQLGKLTKLKNLRLEAGGSLKSEKLGVALKALKELRELELINFVISEELADCLAEMSWLKVFSVWPNKEEEVAPAVNSHLLKATSSMSSLKLLEWGVMNECSSENESFIPLLPRSSSAESGAGDAGGDTGGDAAEDVSLLTQDVSINELIKRLSMHLPDTKIRVFKVPSALIKKACPSRGASVSPSPEAEAVQDMAENSGAENAGAEEG